MTDIGNQVDQKKKEVENQAKILNLFKDIIWEKKSQNFQVIEPGRKFIHQGKVEVFGKEHPAKRELFLFNDYLIVTKIKKSLSLVAKKTYPLEYCIVYSAEEDKEIKDKLKKLAWVLVTTDRKESKSIFVTKDQEERDNWIKEIGECISTIKSKPKSPSKSQKSTESTHDSHQFSQLPKNKNKKKQEMKSPRSLRGNDDIPKGKHKKSVSKRQTTLVTTNEIPSADLGQDRSNNL